MENNNSSTTWALIIMIVIIGGSYLLVNSNKSSDLSINVKTNTQIKATTTPVNTFYDGSEGYSLSIPSGNSSTCIWTYTGGNAAIPGTETTYAQNATQKHTIYSYDYYDWKVSCVDDFGNQYVGVFPSK